MSLRLTAPPPTLLYYDTLVISLTLKYNNYWKNNRISYRCLEEALIITIIINLSEINFLILIA